jgi:hypothetical protein
VSGGLCVGLYRRGLEAVPVVRPLASRNVVEVCADAAVIMVSASAAMVSVFIA